MADRNAHATAPTCHWWGCENERVEGDPSYCEEHAEAWDEVMFRG